MSRAPLSNERLRELVSYDPETGVFRRLICIQKSRIGQQLTGLDTYGYVQICLDKGNYNAHRLAWQYMHGTIPDDDIDHINGIRNDNRILNLRLVSRTVNLQNQRKAHADNRTGYLGVTRGGRGFTAVISINGKRKFLGVFDTAEQAHLAYVSAKRLSHSGCTI